MEEDCSIAFNLENNRKNSEIDIDTEGAGDILELTNKCNCNATHPLIIVDHNIHIQE